MKIIGIEEKIGEFDNKSYHNVNFHCAEEFNNERSNGLRVSTTKVKYDALTESFDRTLTTSEILSLVGQDVDFYYDKYKNVSIVNIIESKSTDKK